MKHWLKVQKVFVILAEASSDFLQISCLISSVRPKETIGLFFSIPIMHKDRITIKKKETGADFYFMINNYLTISVS